ncbi:hypothetical protein Mmc1_2226 [Magnetococcus marinus MC-1]|uniref:Uncharacterized protein n=1 Tax=Magnetococcus marinus (strain ATCC BAA-1437 / JCM 17883 / MC-1) TaxID=156889 RepID=A0L9T4_MAGMM|nr:hypothetical protein [Magnetococcus marinus]ABK44727.1 hypothetical protein Mmc1_2226 [Magnetococcus marinus MC-1]
MAQMTSHKISVHHLGEVSHASFPVVHAFMHDVQAVYFGPQDNRCLSRIRQQVHGRTHYPDTHVVPYCISAHNEEFVERQESRVNCLQMAPARLDAFLADPDCQVSAPTYLSVALQEQAYEILNSAPKTLTRNVVAVSAEVWFLPMVQGGKRYQDVSDLLAGYGFAVENLEAQQGPDAVHGAGLALLFKKPERIIESHPHAALDLLKAAMLAILHSRVDLAHSYLDAFETLSSWHTLGPVLHRPGYLPFLARWRHAMQSYAQVYALPFPELYSPRDAYGQVDMSCSMLEGDEALFGVETLLADIGLEQLAHTLRNLRHAQLQA